MASQQLPPAILSDLPAVTLTQPVPAVLLSEERPSESLSENMECSGNKDGSFTEVVYCKRRLQRSHEDCAPVSSADATITQLPASVGLVVLLVPAKPDTRFYSLNPLQLSGTLNSLHPSCRLEARIKKRKKILAVDTRNARPLSPPFD